MKENIPYHLIAQKKSRTLLDSSSARAYDAWVANDMDSDQVLKDIDHIWEFSADYGADVHFDSQVAFSKFRQSIPEEIPTASTNNVISMRWLSVAASVVLIAAFGILFLSDIVPDTDTHIYASESIENVVLPEKSQIWLRPGSEISYKEEFGVASREVELFGQGFFEIVHDPNQPFVLHLGDYRVEVLGTSFRVEYEEGDFIVVEVEEGSVRFVEEANHILNGGEGLRFDIKNGEATSYELTSPNTIALKRGGLSFNNTPITQVIEDVSSFYDIKIEVESGLDTSDCNWTSPSLNGLSEIQLLELLDHSLIDFESSNGQYNITKIHCE